MTRDDRAQKIAEIRKWHDGKRDSFPPFTVFEAVGVMLDELDRAEKELELFDQRGETIERQLNIIEQLQEESRKLRERLKEEIVWQDECLKLEEQLQSAQQERDMYKSSSEVFYERLKKVAEQREKLFECLRFYERMARGREANDGGRRARTLLAEIGVTVE